MTVNKKTLFELKITMVTDLLSTHLDAGYPFGNFWYVLVSLC